MTRLEIYRKQMILCKAIDIYPRMMSPKELEKVTGITCDCIKRTITKMTNRYLLSEEFISGESYFFYGYEEDKRKTLALIASRIRYEENQH